MESIWQKYKHLNPSISSIKENLRINNQDFVLTSSDNQLSVQTKFNREVSTINKTIEIKQNQQSYQLNAELDLKQFLSPNIFKNDSIKDRDGLTWVVFDNGIDAIAYHQDTMSKQIQLKEWIYARQPNSSTGSMYSWVLAKSKDLISMNILSDGKARLILNNDFSVLLNPIIFWTKTGKKKYGHYQIDNNRLQIVIKATPKEYPLTIDPTFTFGTWLGSSEGNTATVRAVAIETTNDEIYAGGDTVSFFSAGAGTLAGTYTSGNEGFVAEIADGATPTVNWIQWVGAGGTDQVNSVAVNGDEVYAGGYSNSSTASWETVASTAGTYSGAEEGFVVEIADASTPTVAFRQWIGSDGNDRVLALAVTGDEIYAGGYITSSTGNFETVGSTAGTYQGASNGWVAEIADGGPPTVAWRYWVGGSGDDQVTALAVNGDEIYAGGYATAVTSFNTVTNTAGTYSALDEGFVVEIADGGPPTVAWLQWLGAGGNDRVTSLAVTGDEIYAGGYSNSTTGSWETVGSTRGTYNGASEGWVVEIADGAPPTVAWQQWLGSDGNDQVLALAVNGDEIYASGYSASSVTSWDTVGSIVGTFSGGEEAWLVEIADGAPPSVAFQHWLGGSANDEGMAVAVNADELYVGGFSVSGTSVETAGTVVGTYGNGAQMGFVVEVADGSGPSLTWLDWLGGSPGATVIQGLAINSTEIYAAGYSSANAWPGTAAVGGTQSGGQEGFVAEIADASTPSLTWVQWIGSDGTDQATGVAVNGDEIYASGYTTSSTASIDTAGSVAGTYSGGEEGWVVEITDGATPTLNWWQWIGSDGNDRMLSVAVTGDEIYGGGYIASSTANFETVGATAGTYRGASDALVVEIADAGPPTVAWRYWIGAGGDDQILSVAVNGDEIYAGGYSNSSTGTWSPAGSNVGTYHGASEGFVIEIADASPPTIAWRYWLGGSGIDQVLAVAVNGDEIYAGGYSQSSTGNLQTASEGQYGTYSGAQEGFVAEIADGGPPVLNWSYWVGATGNDKVTSLAVNGNEIYAGGFTQSSTGNLETAGTYGGTYSGGDEGWVVEISDGYWVLPWEQWLGGTGTDQVLAVAVNGDEVFAAGSTTSASSWETSLNQFYGNTTGFLVNLNDLYNVSSILYWVGGNGDSPTVNANDWSTTNPSACNDGGGDSSAVPDSSTFVVLDPDCDNNITLTADWHVGAMTWSSGYSGTVATKGYELDVDSSLSIPSGTLSATDSGGEGDGSTISVAGSFDISGSGGFTPDTSTMLLDGTGTMTLTSNAQSFNHLNLNDGLVVYLNFDENALNSCSDGADVCDQSGYGNNATESGTVTYSTSDKPTTYFKNTSTMTFDGSDDLIQIPDSTSLNMNGYATVAMWIKLVSIPGSGAVIFDKESARVEYEFYLSGTNAITFYSGGSSAATGITLPTGEWHHIAVSMTPTISTFYYDGDVTGTGVGYGDDTNTPLTIGNWTSSYPTNMMADEFRLYNRALSQSEIRALVQGYNPGLTASGSSITLQDALDVNGSLTLNSGTLDTKSGSNFGINVAKSWINNGALFTARSGTVTLDGTSGTNTIKTANQDFNILTVSGAGGTWNLNQNMSVGDDLNVSAGTLDFNGYDAVITDNFIASGGTTNIGVGTTSVSGTLTFTGGTVTATSGNLVLNPSTAGETFTSASQSLNNAILTSNDALKGWYKFDETTQNSCSGGVNDNCDSSGNSNDCAWQNSPSIATDYYAPMIANNVRSMKFTGAGDTVTPGTYLNCGSSVSNSMTGSISVSVWARTDTLANQTSALVTKESTTGPGYEGWAIGFAADSKGIGAGKKFTAYYRQSITQDRGYYSNSDVLVDYNWHHYVAIFDELLDDVRLYVDGVQIAVTNDFNNSSWPDPTTTSPLVIGADANGTTGFNGNIDEVRVYNRVLTTEEIGALYRGHTLPGSGTITLQDNLDVNGNVTLGDGTLAAGSKTITVAKNWTNKDATFTYNTSTVDFDDDTKNNTISGNTTFYNLKIDTGTAKTVTFESGKTQTIAAAGTLTLKGAVGQILTLSPGTAATNWKLTLGGTSCTDIQYVTTTYSDASGGEIVDGDGTSVTAGGTNTNWCTSGCSDNCSLSAPDIFFNGIEF